MFSPWTKSILLLFFLKKKEKRNPTIVYHLCWSISKFEPGIGDLSSFLNLE